jgi:cell division protein FtsL
MKRQYLFLVLVCIILYLSYLIVSYKYKEYKINNRIEYLEQANNILTQDIKKNKETLEYLNTRAYKNKILKEEQSMKNKGEKVIFITNEEIYNTYTKEELIIPSEIQETQEQLFYESMSIYERWMYFLFKKDLRNE